MGIFHGKLRYRAGLHICIHCRACGWAGNSDLGADFGDIPNQASCRRPGSRELHTLDFRSIAHDFLSKNGHRFCPGLRILVFLFHDGFATHLGENDGD